MPSDPYVVQQDGSGEVLQAIGEQERAFNESWLQELLRQQPGILPVAEIEPIFYPLISIGREVGTDTGSIDNLFISHRGYLVLVETKLWRNPEARREVIAQAIDYGSSLSKWSYTRLDGAVRAYTEQYERGALGLLDWVEQWVGPVEGGRTYFERTVARNLRLGRFLTVIVGDRIRPSLLDMVSYVNRYPHLAMDIALVELRCYRTGPQNGWPLLVVPEIVARTEIVERSVVQVTVVSDGDYQVDVRQERPQEEGDGRKRITLTEEAFWELLAEQAPWASVDARRLVEGYRDQDGITVEPREASVVVQLDIEETGEQVSLFFINKSGNICVWPALLEEKLVRAGIQRSLLSAYREQMRDILRMAPSRKEFAHSIAEVDVEQFIAAVDELIEQMRRRGATL